MLKNRVLKIFILISFLILIKNSWAWEDDTTHRDISKIAAQKSLLSDGTNIRNLGFEEELNLVQDADGSWVPQWVKSIEDGAQEEDISPRWRNHFFNPLMSWDEAGLSDIWWGDASILWVQSFINEWSWQKEREYHRFALTAQSQTARKENFTKTLQGLGHIIHLLQDKSQPAHVRNDAHPLEGIGLLEGFESWAADNRLQILSLMSNAIFPVFSLNIPLTQFWDTDQYTGLNPSNSLSIGLAEYTNANFFSEDTIFNSFTYPLWSNVVEYDETIDANTGAIRTYLKKLGDGVTDGDKLGYGDPIQHLAAGRWFYKYLPTSYKAAGWGLKLDDQCYNDYASLLIPRAVGYSAGLLNYFFRGQMEVNRVSGGLKVKNTGNEAMSFFTDPRTGEVIGNISIYYDDNYNPSNRKSLATYSLTEPLAPGQETPVITFVEPDDNKARKIYSCLPRKARCGRRSSHRKDNRAHAALLRIQEERHI